MFISLSYSIFAQDGFPRLDTTVQKLADKLLKIQPSAGLSIGIYNNGTTYFYNFGTTEIGKQSTPTQHTIYELGSITKTFVSYILASAVLENKVSLDDDIRKYLKGDYPNLEYDGNPIRLVHLANTTSLLPDWLPELPAEMKNMPADSALRLKIKTYKDFTRQDFFTALHKVKIDTIPGLDRKHSNAGAQLLAYILEDVYKMPMEKLIKKYITGPYKMNNTSFITSAKGKNLAKGYTSSGTQAVYEFVMPYFKNAASLGSSTGDLTLYIKMLLDKTNKAAVLCLQKTVDVSTSTGKVVKMRSDGTYAPDVYSASLNWFSYQPEATSLQIWADGGTNGFNNYVAMYPLINTGIIVLANKSDEKIFRALPGIAYEISKIFAPK